MTTFFIALLLLITVFSFSYWLRNVIKNKRRALHFNKPFPEMYMRHIHDNIPMYDYLPDNLQKELQGHILVFLSEKRFYGFDGVEIDDEIRITVAANACLLLLNRKTEYFPGFVSIYIYPSTYLASNQSFDGVLQTQQPQMRQGESWKNGPIVLAWDAAKHGAADINDGHNVILHEFAHKLDEEDGAIDGAPKLASQSRYTSWARVMYPEFKKLQQNSQRGKRSVLDNYGAGEPAEFFAVLVETFFEKPQQLEKKHPELYAQVKLYFQLDPVKWLDKYKT